MTRSNTIIAEMKCVEDTLKDTSYRAEMIEKRLKTKLLSTEKRERLEKELEIVKDVLRKNEKELQILRKENSKSFVIAGCLVFVCFLLYGLYLMIFGSI